MQITLDEQRAALLLLERREEPNEPALSPLAITPAAVTERLTRRLRHLIGPGRRWSYAEISARTLIDVRTLKAYVSGTACPNLAKYKRLVAVMGAEVAMDLNRMLGWTPRAGRAAPGTLDLASLEAALEAAEDALDAVLGARRGDVVPILRRPPAESRAEGCDLDTRPEFLAPLPARAITPQAIAARLSFRLKRMLASGRPHGVASLSVATGISRAVLEAYLAGTACPNLARYFRLERVLGPELGIEFALMLGWEPRYRASRRFAPERLEALRAHLRATREAVKRLGL